MIKSNIPIKLWTTIKIEWQWFKDRKKIKKMLDDKK